MSNLLKEKCSLTKLREELKRRRGKLYFSCKGFGHLAYNCRNKREGEKGTVTPQNKFEALGSRVMQCGVEEKIISMERRGTSVSVVGEEGKDVICSEAAKGILIEEAGMLCKEKSTRRRKEVEECSKGVLEEAHLLELG